MNFEELLEIRILYLRPKEEGNVDYERLALLSLGLDELGVQIYRHLREKKILTVEDVSRRLQLNESEIINRLDYMYSIGLIDHLGRGYILRKPLHEAIRTDVTRRVCEILEKIASCAEGKKI